MAAPALPTKFPCWVRAVYSWGGESKRDLGFVEGDLIECLNAGDGSWWMGRLKRDRRMVGLFPCNFVQVLEDMPVKPHSQNSSSMSTPVNSGGALSRTSSPASSGPSTPSPQKKTMFRKPFSSHGSVQSSPVGSISSPSKLRPYSSMKQSSYAPSTLSTPSRPQSPSIPSPIARASPLTHREASTISRAASPQPQYISRAASPQPQYISRAASPQPQYISRASSPQPQFISRAASPRPQYASSIDGNDDSSPPPPPPAHRVAYQQAKPNSVVQEPHHMAYGEEIRSLRTPRTPSPSPQPPGMTPSPLRDAMNDVMTSLDDMSVAKEKAVPKTPEEAPSIWSPEAFDEIYMASRNPPRSHTSQGLRHEVSGNDYAEYNQSISDEPPQLSNYVERMENRLKNLQQRDITHEYFTNALPASPYAPTPPPKNSPFAHKRPSSSSGNSREPGASLSRLGSSYAGTDLVKDGSKRLLHHRKSAVELGSRPRVSRTVTNTTSLTSASSTAESTSTDNSNSTQLTSQSIMSGHSAGGFSATSAGSLARRKGSDVDARSKPEPSTVRDLVRARTPLSNASFHSTDQNTRPGMGLRMDSERSIPSDSAGLLGGFSSPKAKKTGFFKKMLDTAKTSAATARSNFSAASNRPPSRGRPASRIGDGVSSISAARSPGSPFKDGSSSGGVVSGTNNGPIDWVQMRRDVNRANSLSRIERTDRAERCEMMDMPVTSPDSIFFESTEGDESADGFTVLEPTNFATASNLALVDKSARFVRDLPATINPISLAQGYLCRQYRSDIQKLRAIFTWVSERIAVEDGVESNDDRVDTRRVLQTHRGSSVDIATVVYEMCTAIGMRAEVVRGYLKKPADDHQRLDVLEMATRPNHAWNMVVCDGEWRLMDCALASPTHPNRAAYSTCAGRDKAEDWWFLARPMQVCWTHVPAIPEQTHLSPPVGHDVLIALPVPGPAFFRNHLSLWDFDTSLLQLEGLEASHVQLVVPDDVELYAEVEARAFRQDPDGDYFESGELITQRALAQAEFIASGPTAVAPTKRYTIKAFLPPSDTQGLLKIYAGGKGLMHALGRNPHQLALTLPLAHSGVNPPFTFFARHPTPHALRAELYVVSPLCATLAANNTFVFQVRQHPGSSRPATHDAVLRASSPAGHARSESALSIARPSSAMSVASVSVAGSQGSDGGSSGSGGAHKAAKLAVQSPSGKIMRMSRKMEGVGGAGGVGSDGIERLGSTWEAIVKIGERGVWRGLVLADRSARWCVFGEWECV